MTPAIFFFWSAEIHKLRRGRWDLASYQVSLNSVQRLQRKSRKCLSQWEAGWPSCFSDRSEIHKLGRGCCDLSSCQVSLNSFSGFREVENVSPNQRPGRPSCVFDRSEKTHLEEDIASCQVSLYSVQRFKSRSRKCLSQLEAGAAILFLLGPKNTNLVEDVEILLPVKFRWILFSGFRGEVENVSANQRPGGHVVFPIGPKNINVVEDFKILLPVKFRWISLSSFRGEVENVKS